MNACYLPHSWQGSMTFSFNAPSPLSPAVAAFTVTPLRHICRLQPERSNCLQPGLPSVCTPDPIVRKHKRVRAARRNKISIMIYRKSENKKHKPHRHRMEASRVRAKAHFFTGAKRGNVRNCPNLRPSRCDGIRLYFPPFACAWCATFRTSGAKCGNLRPLWFGPVLLLAGGKSRTGQKKNRSSFPQFRHPKFPQSSA